MEKFGFGLMVALIGLVIVFSGLLLLILICKAMGWVMGAGKKKEPERVVPVAPTPAPATPAVQLEPQEDEDEIAAVIAAAVMMCQAEGNGLRVRSVRRVGTVTPAWSASGRQEYIATRY